MKTKEEISEYMREYRAKHRDYLIAYKREWYARMGDMINARRRKKYALDEAYWKSELERKRKYYAK